MSARAFLTVALVTSLLLPLITLALPTTNGRPSVTIDSGVVLGITKTENSTGEGLSAFLGIPFADKPIRWGVPQPPKPWSTPFDASNYGPSCIQQFNYPQARRDFILQLFNTPAPPESEDCLNACVYVPMGTNTTSMKTVMVWFYGGAFLYGSNASPLYDGSTLATHEDVIVVVVNYRTNVFGYPGSPQIPITQNNPGFLDQRLALTWVSDNIASFGGDPSKITIFGESAGAGSVDNLITLPPTPIPFRAAIMQSGQSTFRAIPTEYSSPWKNLTTAMNCSSAKDILACMRALPAATIKNYNELTALPWTPIFDNITSASTARSNRLNSTAANPIIARVPILSGTNADEGRLYSISAAAATANGSTSFVRELFPTANNSEIAALLAAYPIGGPPASDQYYTTGVYNSTLEQLGALYTDFVFQCPARLVHLDSSRVGVPSWRYYYNASFPNIQPFPHAGVYHSSEIPLMLGTYPHPNVTIFQEALSRYMQNLWANFAKNPTGFNAVAWPSGPGAMGVLGGGVRAEDGGRRSGAYMVALNGTGVGVVDRRCALFEGVYDMLGR